jgi:hypothetical protein
MIELVSLWYRYREAFKAGNTDSPIGDRSGIGESNLWRRLYLCPSVFICG